MSLRSKQRARGFTLLEMVVAMALGIVVLGAAVQMYTQSVSATWTVSQRAEMQQDFRAASNMLTKDLSLAGAGLNPGAAIALPASTTPIYGCDQAKCYLNGVAGTYPLQGGTPYLYGLIPGYDKGPTFYAAQGATDVVTVVYTDPSLYLNCYIPTVTAKGVVTFSQPKPPTTWITEGCLPGPTPPAGPQAVNDPAVGLTTGDLVLLTLGGTTMVSEVTGTVTTGIDANGNATYVVPFANGDALKMNQTPAGGGLNTAALNAAGSASAAPCGGTGPCRLLVVTYYLDNTVSPPRLMRQVSGHSPVPVAENIVYLKFSYDLFNSTTGTPAVNQPNPGSGDANDTASNGLLPNQITKINVLNMAIDSALTGSIYGTKGYQSMDLQTSVSARNLTYVNDYPN
jgi:prepilin-type N-terminal cleavage/methylation domain-containing protein